jgi:hypothetical protein
MSVDEAPEGEAPDPWESITVLWDSNDNSADLEHKVRHHSRIGCVGKRKLR